MQLTTFSLDNNGTVLDRISVDILAQLFFFSINPLPRWKKLYDLAIPSVVLFSTAVFSENFNENDIKFFVRINIYKYIFGKFSSFVNDFVKKKNAYYKSYLMALISIIDKDQSLIGLFWLTVP